MFIWNLSKLEHLLVYLIAGPYCIIIGRMPPADLKGPLPRRKTAHNASNYVRGDALQLEYGVIGGFQ
jgi:hypothetical protein